MPVVCREEYGGRVRGERGVRLSAHMVRIVALLLGQLILRSREHMSEIIE
jgi:hypothetical protein